MVVNKTLRETAGGVATDWSEADCWQQAGFSIYSFAFLKHNYQTEMCLYLFTYWLWGQMQVVIPAPIIHRDNSSICH